MNPLTLMMVYLTILLGPIVTMLSSNFLLMWVGLEMSLLAMIPLLMYKKLPRSTEAATKYFLTQATASMIMLMAITMNLIQLGSWSLHPQTNKFIMITIFIALMMKLGLAPFHTWLPEVTQGAPLNSGLILLTWQKIAPLSILYQIHELLDPNLTTPISMISVFMGAWGGLNQTQMRKIMAYSSIAHMGWMVAILPYNPLLTLMNLIIYILMTTSMFLILMSSSHTTINSMSLSWNKYPMMTPLVASILLSLGGLPPLSGFMPKWLIINELLKNNSIPMASLIALMALLNLFFYTRLIYSTSLTIFPTNNNSKLIPQQLKSKISPLLPSLTILSTMAMPMTPLLTM